jgi:hypothetical protein
MISVVYLSHLSPQELRSLISKKLDNLAYEPLFEMWPYKLMGR